MTIDRIRTAESNEIAQQSNKLEATANILPTDLPGGLDLEHLQQDPLLDPLLQI
jgi:hypothetical protein